MHSLFPVAVHLFFFRTDRVLLSRRFNTGWEDGKYSVPAGHVEAGESVIEAAIREAREEVGTSLKPENIQVVHVMHRKAEEERIDFFWSSRVGRVKSPTRNRTGATSWHGIL